MMPVAIGQPCGEGGGVVQVAGFVGQVVGGFVGVFAWAGELGGGGSAAEAPATWWRGLPAWSVTCWRTQVSAAGSPSGKKHPAASQRYSRTWMRSMTIGTSTPRVLASALIRSIWWLLPSTSATQVRRWSGSRRSASSKTRRDHGGGVVDDAGGEPLVLGLRARGRRGAWRVAGRMSAGVRGTGVTS